MAATVDLFTAHHPDLRPPRSVRMAGEPPWRRRTSLTDLPHVVAAIAAAHADGQLAIITPPIHLVRLRTVLSLAKSPAITDPVVVLTPWQAKGLEFDSVLIVDPAEILMAPLGHNDLYVAMTRAVRRLGIVHPGPAPAELSRIRERADPPVKTRP